MRAKGEGKMPAPGKPLGPSFSSLVPSQVTLEAAA